MVLNKQKRKLKKRLVPLIVILFVIAAGAIFLQFTHIGFRMTVPYRHFSELRNNVYVANDYSGDLDDLNAILDEAAMRVSNFWGSIESSPVIIICDNEKTLGKLGGDHNTATVIFFKAHSYISISPKYLNVDIMAHEMTHAELHARLYEGKLPKKLIPVWFDEGVATQNDYRVKYNDAAWNDVTNNGLDIIELSQFDTASEFYSGEELDRVYRYIVSRHELQVWISRRGIDGLIELMSRVNSGNDFNELYFSR